MKKEYIVEFFEKLYIKVLSDETDLGILQDENEYFLGFEILNPEDNRVYQINETHLYKANENGEEFWSTANSAHPCIQYFYMNLVEYAKQNGYEFKFCKKSKKNLYL